MGESCILNFAYGANTNPRVLERRGVTPLRSLAARLPEHELVFNMPGIPALEPAFANVRRRAGSSVYGVLHWLRLADQAKLDRQEGEGWLYKLVREEVVAEDGTRHAALLYRAWRHFPIFRPSRRYLELIIAGAEHHNLPDGWIARLRATPSVDWPRLRRLFGRKR